MNKARGTPDRSVVRCGAVRVPWKTLFLCRSMYPCPKVGLGVPVFLGLWALRFITSQAGLHRCHWTHSPCPSTSQWVLRLSKSMGTGSCSSFFWCASCRGRQQHSTPWPQRRNLSTAHLVSKLAEKAICPLNHTRAQRTAHPV